MNKTLKDWEMETGMFAYEPSKFGSKTMSEEEFKSLIQKDLSAFHGVNVQDRTKFLKDNGYEVNRENLFADLSAKPQQEE